MGGLPGGGGGDDDGGGCDAGGSDAGDAGDAAGGVGGVGVGGVHQAPHLADGLWSGAAPTFLPAVRRAPCASDAAAAIAGGGRRAPRHLGGGVWRLASGLR